MIVNLDLELCKGEKTLEKQLEKIKSEFYEAEFALEEYTNKPNGKNRAEILFELLDIINATQTAIMMEFTEKELEEGITYTNAKSYIRGYLRDEEKKE
jgi:hypothetical protein